MAHFVLIFIFGFCGFKVLFFVLEKVDAINREIKNKQAPPYSADMHEVKPRNSPKQW